MRWYLGAAAILLVALVFQLGLLAYAMYVLLGLMLVSRYLSRYWIEHLEAQRECNRLTAEIGDKLAVLVQVKNTGRFPVAWVLIEDSLPRQAIVQRPPRLKVHGKRLMIAMLRPGARKSLHYQLEFQMRGYYQLGPVVLETGDLFGLHRRYRVGTAPHFVLVHPRLVPLVGYDLASRRPIGEIRLTHRLFEDPTRIAGLRLYQAGDPLNRVNWRATARTGVLHSKIYEPSTIAGASILLAFHQDEYPRPNEPVRSELAVTTAASVANAVYLLGQQVGLATNGRDAADRIRQEGWAHDFRTRAAAKQNVNMRERSDRLQPVVVPTRRGHEQFQRILETLARVELTDGLTFDQLVLETVSRLPRDATVVAVLPTVSEPTAFALGSLRRRGYAVTAVLIAFSDDEYVDGSGRLLAEGVETRRVADEASLSALCGQHLLR
ncbi:MAG TPA: DUF58 domain-containing protein [Pirellulales bacterium]|nr:DUF58 domain-containing protein [Pirellulales bacterium]